MTTATATATCTDGSLKRLPTAGRDSRESRPAAVCRRARLPRRGRSQESGEGASVRAPGEAPAAGHRHGEARRPGGRHGHPRYEFHDRGAISEPGRVSVVCAEPRPSSDVRPRSWATASRPRSFSVTRVRESGSGRQADAAIVEQRPGRVVRHLPGVPVRIDEHARVTTPGRVCRLAANPRSGRSGFFDCLVDLGG